MKGWRTARSRVGASLKQALFSHHARQKLKCFLLPQLIIQLVHSRRVLFTGLPCRGRHPVPLCACRFINGSYASLYLATSRRCRTYLNKQWLRCPANSLCGNGRYTLKVWGNVKQHSIVRFLWAELFEEVSAKILFPAEMLTFDSA